MLSALSVCRTAGFRRNAHTLVMMRHGQSQWNLDNKFTGWVDVALTEKGEAEAKEAGRLLKEGGFEFDAAFSSVLQRALKTLWITLEETNQVWIPVTKDYRLNERHYGGLTGLDKAETAAKHGEEQVLVWRRSYDIPPPPVSTSDEYWPGHDRRYAGLPTDILPLSESLKTTADRVLPFWESDIAPAIKSGQRIIVAAHGNSLRALVKHLDSISDEDIVNLNIPTGVPLVYELDDSLRPIPHPDAAPGLSGRYLGDADAIAAEAKRVAEQAKAK